MYHWYQDSDGKYLGQSDLMKNFPDPLPAGTSIVEILPKELREGIWNTVTRTFDPRPVKNKLVSKRQFLNSLTDAEQKGIILLSKTNDNAELFLTRLKLIGDVEVGSYLQTALNYLESQGILAAGRAAEIYGELNG